ncbi:MAG: FAD:protein FMN transferase [Bacteroidales bacterium]|nr:FAD:protein FMN transferase [Bacteroidales bacterium]
MSTYVPNSIISRFNRNETGVIPDEHFLTIYKKAVEVNKKTNGAFDITVAPIVNAWGFGYTEKNDADSAKIDSLLQYVGMDKLILEGKTIQKKDPNVMFDFNAIAQGYSVDLVADFLESKGISAYMVEIGGEIKAKGKNPKNSKWRIGIDRPIDNNVIPGATLQNIIEISNYSLATSGNYRKFIEKEGRKYGHIINPKTGYPEYSNMLSVTVIAKDCMVADAYATSFMVMGKDKTIEFLNNNRELEAYLIFSDDSGNF